MPRPGNHLIVVNATDNFDLTGTSQVSIEVQPAYPPPVWARQPRGQAVPAGSGVVFFAQAVSAWPLSYQWYFNDQPIAGASHRLLLLNAVQSDSDGTYWAVANNASAYVTSQVAVLSVIEAADVLGADPPGFHRLSIAGFDELGVPVLSLEADSEGPFTLQATSPSLTNWLDVCGFTNNGSPFYFTDPAAAGTVPGARFYRTVRIP